MPAIDFSDPIRVFCRLAQLTADSQHRLAEMDRLDEEQSEADRELSQIRAIAKAYMQRADEKCFEVTATPPGAYHSSTYFTALDDEGSVICRRREYITDLEPLTPDEIAEALMSAEDASTPSAEDLIRQECDRMCRRLGDSKSDRDHGVKSNGEHSYKLPLSAFDPPSNAE